MTEQELKKKNESTKTDTQQTPKSEEWATEALEELDDFIESQGIYIRQ